MGPSLAYRLDVAMPHVPRALVTPDAFGRLRRIGETLPASLSRSMLLECRLHDDERVDLSVGLDRAGCRRFFRTQRTEFEQRDGAFGARGWEEIRHVAGAGTGPNLPPSVTRICFEFDGDWRNVGHGGIHVPSLFLRLPARDRRRRDERDAHRRDLRAVLSHLAPRPGADLIGTPLTRCLRVLPDAAAVSWLARMFSRDAPGVRVCVSGLPKGEAGAYLDAIGWEGSGARLDREVKRLRLHDTDVTLAFDLHRSVGPRVGLELRCRRTHLPRSASPVTSPPYGVLLQKLAQQGLCTDAKRAAATAWHRVHRGRGLSTRTAALVYRCELVKLVAQPGRPMEAKVYLGVVQTDLAEGRF